MQLTEKQKKNGREAIEYIEREFGEDAMFLASDMSLKDIVAIKNMWPGRASYIMQVMHNGLTFQEAQRHTCLLYDTNDFGEILSRLARARGILLRAAVTCYRSPGQGSSLFDSHMSLNGIWQSLVELENRVAEYELAPTEQGSVRKSKITCSSIPKNINRGRIKSAFSFIKKCARDLPLMPEKNGVHPTKLQLSYVLIELGKIKMALNLIHDAINNPNSGFCETDSAEDPLGVGRPYNQYLSFVAPELSKLIQLPTDFDADCFLACWLAKTFLLTGTPLVQFAGAYVSDHESTCSINTGDRNEPDQLIFSGNTSGRKKSVSRIVYDHLGSNENEIARYRHWVELIEEDLQSESRPSLQLIESRSSGIHSIFENLSKATDNPVEMYNAFSSWIFGKVHDLS